MEKLLLILLFSSSSFSFDLDLDLAHRITGVSNVIHRVLSETRGCIVHVHTFRTHIRGTIISESPAAALSTCCPQADRATDTGLALVRPFPMLARTLFLTRRSCFRNLRAIPSQNVIELSSRTLCPRTYGSCLSLWRGKLCAKVEEEEIVQ